MSGSRSCPRCQRLLTEHPTDGVCPSCGSPVVPPAEALRGQDTPDDRDAAFTLGQDPDATRTHATAKGRQGTPSPGFTPPDVPNHTDFELLGQGGMGVVFRAVQRSMNRAVAVKVMLSFAPGGPYRERFLAEVRALARLKHPGVVQIFEAGECQLGPYFTMELVEGVTLAQRIRQGPIDRKEAARIVADAADAVHAAHCEGVIHRDVKPSNILLGRDGAVKVTDFGLAKHVGGDDLTATGLVLGTPCYMSPEQAEADPDKVTKLADVYCLGGTLYHLLTGRPPHQGATPREALRRKEADPTPRPRQACPDLCPTLDAIVARAMAAAPGDRFATAADLASDLRKWAADEETDTRPLTRWQKVRLFARRHRVAAAAALLVALLVPAVALAVQEMDPRRQLERALARGERVVLVGETGLPRWHEWKLGEARLGPSVLGDGSAGMQVPSGAFLVLAADPMREEYRFSIELRHADHDTTNDIGVGVFLGFESLATTTGQKVERWLAAGYSDDYLPVAKNHPGRMSAHGLSVREELAIHYPDDVRYATSEYGRLRFKPVGRRDTHNDWRRIVAEVRPSGISISFQAVPGGDLARAVAMGRDRIEAAVAGFNNPDQLPTTRLHPFRWNPRRPLGVFARHSTLAFRHATIEPLADDP